MKRARGFGQKGFTTRVIDSQLKVVSPLPSSPQHRKRERGREREREREGEREKEGGREGGRDQLNDSPWNSTECPEPHSPGSDEAM